MSRLFQGTVLAVFLGGVLLMRGSAQTPPPTPSDDQINAIAGELYCPVCENVPLDVCGTQACEQWRGLIREKLAQGYTKEEIKQYFVDQYGDRVLAAPPAKGFNILVYIVPPLAILAGIYSFYRILITGKKTVEPQQKIAIPSSDQEEFLSLLEEELKNR